MIYFPGCKINLGLSVVNKRDDGYHNLETIMYRVESLSDILEIVPSDTFSFTSSGLAIDCDVNDNSAVKAYKILQEKFDLSPVSIHLHKVVPFGAGLGGGSANAVAALKAVNDIFELKLSIDDLKYYASKLGSDNAFFVEGGTQYCTGRGEVTEPLKSPLYKGLWLSIIKPHFGVSTKEAFDGIIPSKKNVQLSDIIKHPIKEWQGLLINDFEATVFAKHQLLYQIKSSLIDLGAEYVSMSGSGSSIFSISTKPIDVHRFSEMGYFVHSTSI